MNWVGLGVVGVVGVGVPRVWGAVVYQARETVPQGTHVISDLGEASSFLETVTPGEARSRVGDRITLAGTDRYVTTFSTRVGSFSTRAAAGLEVDVELSLYASVPTAGGLGGASGSLPGALLWRGVVAGVVVPARGTGIAQTAEVVFSPLVTVPDTMFFAVGFTAVRGGASDPRDVGVLGSTSVSVGSSPGGVVEEAGDGGVWSVPVYSVQTAAFRHVDAVVVAVPGPGAAGLGVIACAVVGVRQRRRGRSLAA